MGNMRPMRLSPVRLGLQVISAFTLNSSSNANPNPEPKLLLLSEHLYRALSLTISNALVLTLVP